MNRIKSFALLFILIILIYGGISCNKNKIESNEPTPTGEPFKYLSFYDEFKDKGQYWIPINAKKPEKYWN